MSLLYKALTQATQQREKGAQAPLKSSGALGQAASVTAPGAAPSVAGRMTPHTLSSSKSSAPGGRMSRWILLSLVGVTGIISAGLLLMPEAPLEPLPPQLAQLPEPAAATPSEAVAPEVQPEAVESLPPSEAISPDQSAESAPVAPAEPDTVPPEPVQPPQRIGADSAPSEPPPVRAPKHVSDAGVEKFVDAQLAGREMAALGPPVDLKHEGDAAALAQERPGMQITNDTDMARARYENALRLLEGGEPAQAEHIYAQILRDDPNDRLALLGRAAALQKMQRTQQALAAFEAVLAAYPGDEWALTNLLALLSTQNSTQALEQLQRLIRLNPQNALVPAQVGMLHLARGEYEPAARHLERAVALEPRNAKYAFNLAVVYDKWGQPETALRFYAQCLDLATRAQDAQIPVETVRQRMAFLTVK